MYSLALAQAVGEAMTAATGIPVPITTVWAGSESGTRNNPYGLTSGGQLVSFATWREGVAAAASWLMRDTRSAVYYTGVRSAVKGGDPYTIMRAIEAAPWGPPGYYSRTWPAVAKAYGITLPAEPAKGAGTMVGTRADLPSTGNAHADAIQVNAQYLANGPADPTPYLEKIHAYLVGLVAQLPAPATVAATATNIVTPPTAQADPAPATPHPLAGTVWPWTDVEEGSVPTVPPSVDTYGTMQQVAEVAAGKRMPDPGTPAGWASQPAASNALAQLVAQIVDNGVEYWPLTAYPPIPAWVFDAATPASLTIPWPAKDTRS